jgi:LacI family transcriptional regulator
MTKSGQATTLEDVARAAKVSISTVSRVIRGERYVRDSTRETVQLAMERLEYRPSRIARSLKRGDQKTGTICLYLRNPKRRFSEPFFIEFLAGVTDAATAAEYDVLISTKHAEKTVDEAIERILYSQLSDGMIHMSTGASDAVIAAYQRYRMPVVIYGEPLGRLPCVVVGVDNRGGARVAVEHLISLGHRRIAFIGGPPDASASRAREDGFGTTMAAHCLTVPPNLLRAGSWTEESGYGEMCDLLQASPIPTAVFAASDTIAFGAMKAVWEAGLSIPRDISIVGFDDIPQASNARPPLTTVRQPMRPQGFETASKLLALIRGGDAPVTNRVFPVELILRESSARLTGVPDD